MGVIVLIVGLGLIAWGIVLGKQHINEHHAIEKYKFENRSSGGAVQFADYDATVAFRKREMRQSMRAKLFVGVLVFGLFCVLGAFFSFGG